MVSQLVFSVAGLLSPEIVTNPEVLPGGLGQNRLNHRLGVQEATS